jgi:hypothetical protein
MKGKNNVLQKKILDLNPSAFYARAANSLNLVLNDAANVSNKTAYIPSSTHHKFISLVEKHLSNLTVKLLSDAGWETRLKAISFLRTSLETFPAPISISDRWKQG